MEIGILSHGSSVDKPSLMTFLLWKEIMPILITEKEGFFLYLWIGIFLHML